MSRVLSLFEGWLVLFMLLCALPVAGQYEFKGRVTDAATGEPIPFASVALRGKPIGTTANFDGYFVLKARETSDSLVCTYLGYKRKAKAVSAETGIQEIHLQLEAGASQLREVVVRSGENPAYDIIRKVRKTRDRFDRNQLDAYEYDSYTKTEIDIDNLSDSFRKRKVVRKINEALEKADKLAGEDGKPLLPTFVSETFSRFYYRSQPERKKERILHTYVQGVGVKDGSFVSQLIGGNFLQSFNFYHNFITFLGKDLVSPIGENWKGSYDYFLADTVVIDQDVCYEIEFEPRRSQDLAFRGKLWIDTTLHALREIEATIGKEANLNYIEQLKISQELGPVAGPKGEISAWLPMRTRFLVDIEQLTKNSAGMLAKFQISNRNFVLNKPKEPDFYNPALEVAEDARDNTPEFWEKHRPEVLTKEDQIARHLIDTVKNLPVVRTYVDIAELATTGWKKYEGIEFGPYLYSFAWNRIEGLRLRLGFRTNPHFSKHWIFRGHVAYGTLDNRLKYSGEMNYLFSRKRWTVAGLRYYHDIERIGLTPDMIGDNKLFYAFTRFGQARGAYMQTDQEVFVKSDIIKNLTVSGSFTTREYEPQFTFFYKTAPEMGENSPRLTNFHDTFVTLEARYAKNEQYLMDGNERVTLGTKRIPVLSLRYTRGIRGLLNGRFNYHRFQLSAYQTLRMGTLGRSNYRFTAGYTPSTVPPMLLFPHLGNPTGLFNRNAYNLLDFFEYVSDRYVSMQYFHSFDGLLTNRLPLVRKWKLRTFALANVLVGEQSASNQNLVDKLKIPQRTHYEYSSLDPSKPYVEVGYGVENIFRIFRVTALHRLTYRDIGGRDFAIKASVHFSF